MGTRTTVTPTPERGRTWAVSVDDSLEEIVEHVPVDLVLAEDERANGLDELEHDFWNDPCHFLRRACQAADYGATSTIRESAQTGCGPR